MTIHDVHSRDLHAELDSLLAGDEPDYDTEPVTLDDADDADRALRHLARLQTETDQAIELANTQRARIDLWLTLEHERTTKAKTWWSTTLERYHRNVLTRDPKKRTITLPTGKLTARAQQPVWEFDEAVFLAWADDNAAGLITVPEPKPPAPKPDRDAAKAVLTIPGKPKEGDVVAPLDPEGNPVPGVRVTIRGPKFRNPYSEDT